MMNNMQVETQNLRLIACPHVLSSEKGRIDVQRPAGGNVNDLLRSIQIDWSEPQWTPESQAHSFHARTQHPTAGAEGVAVIEPRTLSRGKQSSPFILRV